MEMNEKFMKFVHQCLVSKVHSSGRWIKRLFSRRLSVVSHLMSISQYFEDEGMDLVKAGKLIPQPRHNLVFDYGKVGYWAGK